LISYNINLIKNKNHDTSVVALNGGNKARPLKTTTLSKYKNAPAFACTNKIKISRHFHKRVT
jgi:hypothetical protein